MSPFSNITATCIASTATTLTKPTRSQFDNICVTKNK